MITEPYKLYTKSYVNPTSLDTESPGYTTIAGTTVNTETFDTRVLAVTIKAKTNDIIVYLSYAESGDYDDPILLEASGYSGDTLSVSYNCKRVKIVNANTSGDYNGSYLVIGWSDQ